MCTINKSAHTKKVWKLIVVILVCCILDHEKLTHLLQEFHSSWPFCYWESFPLSPQIKIMLSFPYHSSFWQSLDHMQVQESVVHQTHLPWSSRMTKQGEPRLWVGSIHHQYLMLWQTVSSGTGKEIWSFLDWRLIIFGMPTFRVSHKALLFHVPVFVSCSAVLHANKAEILYKYSLLTKEKVHHPSKLSSCARGILVSLSQFKWHYAPLVNTQNDL